ncbi:recombinase family protein [Sphingomonas solaris]|uniref:Recombinase family protein n=1 Tax=Alterirhizorhabdus solaris TaxID=2529389 RepID=A0A558R5P9_9SPHN|nr:recombinase family protein [Sphingomonas solaris]
MKVALYARYSSDSQRDASIADQLRVCRAHAERQGWQIIEEYTDHAISGASLLRPGIQAMIADALSGRFQLVLAEAMDRLSRDQEDIAGLFKRMAYGDVKIITLSEGEVTQLHVGLKGTMNALFLKDLADKTRRGLRGRVEQGKSGGGNSYGYTVVKQFDAHGEAVRGDRTIHADQAAVVRRIFSDYAAGKSAKRIAVELNREGISAPNGGDWGFSTINGNPKRGTGILNNELYVGKLIWNRQRFVKDPATGKRQARLNAPEDRITQEVPELRIIDDETWSMVKARQSAMRAEKPEPDASTLSTARDRKRPRYLLSGLTRCGCCGGGYSMISSEMLGCSTARNKGTCDNRTNMRRDELEARVLAALRHHLMEPALFAEFCEEFTREMNRIRSAGSETLEASRAQIRKIDRDLDRLVDMILRGGAADRLNERMVRMEARKRELEAVVAQSKEPAPLLHPEMAGYYRRQVESLHEALNSGPEAERLKAADLLRSLISAIVLTPSDSGLEMDVQGDLAGILTIASNAKSPAILRAGLSQVEMVAGTGFEPVTFRL